MIDIDYEICMGTGDYPSGGRINNKTTNNITPEHEQQYKKQGLIQDSTGSWFNPKSYIDMLFIDW